MNINKRIKVSAIVKGIVLASFVGISSAHAGSIFLTGHDILSHGNQNNYDDVILNYLRGSIAAADYDIGLVGGGSLSGFGTVTTNGSTFATGTDFSTFLSGIDALVVREFSAGFLNTYESIFTTWFNAGGDIWVDTSNGASGYYDWLPPGATADGPGINTSSGFSPTAAGTAIGILPNMVNGFPTHNRFTSWAPAFTVLETHSSFPNDAISIGLQDATITGGGIIGGGGITVPEPSTLAIFALGIMGLVSRRFKKQ